MKQEWLVLRLGIISFKIKRYVSGIEGVFDDISF